jgi:N-methylhydantoinase A
VALRPLVSSGERRVQLNGGEQAIPVYRLCDQAVGAIGSGPAIIEDEFFTGLVEARWKMSVLDGRDVLLQAE